MENARMTTTTTSKATRVLNVLDGGGEYTAIQLAHMILGPLAQQPEINEVLRQLVREGLVERRGSAAAIRRTPTGSSR
jgi:hypothetical protein